MVALDQKDLCLNAIPITEPRHDVWNLKFTSYPNKNGWGGLNRIKFNAALTTILLIKN